MPENLRLARFGQWLIQILLFVVIPLLIFFFGFNHIDQLHQANRLSIIEQNLAADLLSFEMNHNTETFLARIFLEAFQQASAGNPGEVMSKYHQRLDRKFDYILWDDSGRIIQTTIATEKADGDWSKAWKTLQKPFIMNSKDLQFTDEEMINVRKLIGPQLVMEGIDNCRSENNERLLWTDSAGNYPLTWISYSRTISLIVFVDSNYLNSKPGLQYFIKYAQPSDIGYQLGYIENHDILSNSHLPDLESAKAVLSQHSLSAGLRFETANAFYYPRVIDNNMSIFAVVARNREHKGEGRSGIIAAFVLMLLLLPFVVFSAREAFTGKQLRISLSRKLGLLFIYSNGLPLAMLFFMGYDYINQKQYALLDELHAQGIRFLQNFDERFESEHSLRIFKIQSAIEDLKTTLAKTSLNYQSFSTFARQLTQIQKDNGTPRFFMVASDCAILGTAETFEMNNQMRKTRTDEIAGTEEKKRSEEYRISRTIGEYILGSLNGMPADAKSATEVELLAESTMQKTITEIQHEFIAGAGRIAAWGMGSNIHFAYIDLISLAKSQKYDYLLMYTWMAGNLENSYLNRQYLNATRNINNLQIIITNEKAGIYYPAASAYQMSLRKRMKSFTHKPNATRQFIIINDCEYLIMGLQGKNLQNFCLAGLYPVNEVRVKIYEEKKTLITAGILSLLLALALGQLLSHSILFPLQVLANGADAIRQRDFAHRLPELGHDEFGEMAQLFNETMVDLEELKVAGAVQDHLLPKKLPESGQIKLFGKNISMGDLGGDYYDYFNTSANRFSILIGDVSGHGAGAALVMAMAKAGVMHMHEYLEKPAELIMKMHELIVAARSNSQQFMTFQYLNFDYLTARAVYANAGGWNPLIINPTTHAAREIVLPGPMLGALKRPRFSETEISLAEGEALLLYTDGLVEGSNSAGRQLGIDGLKDLGLKCFDHDPQIYCARLLEAFRIFTEKKKLEDDITVLVVIRS